jgi:hypothetical protein
MNLMGMGQIPPGKREGGRKHNRSGGGAPRRYHGNPKYFYAQKKFRPNSPPYLHRSYVYRYHLLSNPNSILPPLIPAAAGLLLAPATLAFTSL